MPSTKLRSLTGALQEAHSDAQAAEEGKEQNISVMHLNTKAREQGSRDSTTQTAAFISGTILTPERWTGLDQVQ